ncbi:MAG: hypothetical protein GX173_14690, partial [Ruminococcaceae bacterium]|nr:hypothetical protein [Oscillospiraceae bacterium]
YVGGITNRFAAYTGNVIVEKPLNDCTKAVLTTLKTEMRKSEKTNYSDKRDGDRETFDIVCNLRRAISPASTSRKSRPDSAPALFMV